MLIVVLSQDIYKKNKAKLLLIIYYMCVWARIFIQEDLPTLFVMDWHFEAWNIIS